MNTETQDYVWKIPIPLSRISNDLFLVNWIFQLRIVWGRWRLEVDHESIETLKTCAKQSRTNYTAPVASTRQSSSTTSQPPLSSFHDADIYDSALFFPVDDQLSYGLYLLKGAQLLTKMLQTTYLAIALTMGSANSIQANQHGKNSLCT